MSDTAEEALLIAALDKDWGEVRKRLADTYLNERLALIRAFEGIEACMQEVEPNK